MKEFRIGDLISNFIIDSNYGVHLYNGNFESAPYSVLKDENEWLIFRIGTPYTYGLMIPINLKILRALFNYRDCEIVFELNAMDSETATSVYRDIFRVSPFNIFKALGAYTFMKLAEIAYKPESWSESLFPIPTKVTAKEHKPNNYGYIASDKESIIRETDITALFDNCIKEMNRFFNKKEFEKFAIVEKDHGYSIHWINPNKDIYEGRPKHSKALVERVDKCSPVIVATSKKYRKYIDRLSDITIKFHAATENNLNECTEDITIDPTMNKFLYLNLIQIMFITWVKTHNFIRPKDKDDSDSYYYRKLFKKEYCVNYIIDAMYLKNGKKYPLITTVDNEINFSYPIFNKLNHMIYLFERKCESIIMYRYYDYDF